MNIYPKTKFLNLTMKCCSTLGIFPSEFLFDYYSRNGRFCYSMYSKTCLSIFGFFLITSYMKLFDILRAEEIDLAELSKNLIVLPIFTITMMRQFIIITPQFKKLLRYVLRTDKYMEGVKDDEVLKIDTKAAVDLNKCIKVYLCMMVITEISYTTRPLFEPEKQITRGNFTTFMKPLPLSTWFPFKADEYFVIAYFINVIYIVFGSCYDTYNEFIVIVVIAYPTAKLKILKHVLENLNVYQERMRVMYGIDDKNDAAFITLRLCKGLYEKIVRYVHEFNAIVGTCMFLDFLQSSVHMATVLVEAATQPFSFMQTISVAAFLLVLNFRLFLYYYYANEVIILSQSLRRAIYECGWCDYGSDIKRMILFMMMRFQRPIKYKLGVFGEMSLKRFLSILNTTYSYVMLMLSVQ